MPSFDIVSKVDSPSVDNGVDLVPNKIQLNMILKVVLVELKEMEMKLL